MVEDKILLSVKNLSTSFFTDNGEVKAVRGVSFDVKRSEIVGIVGESGSGKSVTMSSLIQLLASSGKVVSGSVHYEGKDILSFKNKELRRLRNNQIAMVFQDPMTSLNPTLTVQLQIAERLVAFDDKLTKEEAKKRAVELLEMVRIPDAAERVKCYPFEMSGGMRQRVMLAIAFACKPRLLIADEPTTALDVTIQSQILRLIKELRDDTGSSIILITHNMGVVAETCERVIVMYGGMIMEEGSVDEIFYNTAHPYTAGLKKSIPDPADNSRTRLYSIPGSPPSLMNPPKGCPFCDRCRFAMQVCKDELPPDFSLSITHKSRCWLWDSQYPGDARKEALA